MCKAEFVLNQRCLPGGNSFLVQLYTKYSRKKIKKKTVTTTSKAKPKDIQDIIHPLLSKAVLCRCGSSAQMLLHEGVCSQESKHWQKRANTEPCLLCYINFGGICLRCSWPCADMDRFLMICLAMAGNDHVLIPAGIQWFPSQGLLQSSMCLLLLPPCSGLSVSLPQWNSHMV